MEIQGNVQSANFNTKWLDNIYENLKKIEEFERYAREGCASILDYLSIPFEMRNKIIADIQYKNLRCIFNEMKLVIPDLAPVLTDKDIEEFDGHLNTLKVYLDNRSLLIKENYSEVNKSIISSSTTPAFEMVLEALAKIRREIIMDIKHIVYVKPTEAKSW